jgi:hypothetical protein
MKMDREQFFKSLLDKHSGELLNKARALVAKLEAEPPWVGEHNSMRVKGLPDSIDQKTNGFSRTQLMMEHVTPNLKSILRC